MTARAGSGMRDALGCHFELRHAGVWRAAVAIVAACAIGALVAWLVSGSLARPLSVRIAGALGVVAVGGVAISLCRVELGTLRRQGGVWTFRPGRAAGGEPEGGDVSVALDLGTFMLLVLSRPGAGRRWLPVQHRGHETSWHALRCAAHAPRPAAADAA